MRLIHGTLTGAWIVIGINLLMAFGAIGVFARMSPAIAIILERNDRSLEASEAMLAALAREAAGVPTGEGDPAETSPEARFEAALRIALGNVTEPEERPALEAIEASYEAALDGDALAAERAVEAIETLTSINRLAMARADERAEQLGRAGGWAVAIMAGLAFVASLVLLRQLDRKLIGPLEEVHDVLSSFRGGDRRRRCSLADGNAELRGVCRDLNAILDRLQDAERG